MTAANAFTAVNAASRIDFRVSVLNADCLGRTSLQTDGTARTLFNVE